MKSSSEPVCSLVDSAGYFRVSVWRRLLDAAALATSSDCDAICPFGFELSGDVGWLKRPINRFYVLVGSDFATPLQAKTICGKFAEQLMDQLLVADQDLHRRIAFIRVCRTQNIELKGSGHIPSDSDSLLSVIPLRNKRGALAAYTDYLISLAACTTFCHGEFVYFDRHPRARRRLIQLTYMVGWIGESLGLRLPTAKDATSLTHLYATELQDFYAGNRMQPPNDAEVSFLRNVALPTFKTVRRYLHDRIELHPYTFETEDLFTGKRISATLNAVDYERLVEKLMKTYLSHTEPMTAAKRGS